MNVMTASLISMLTILITLIIMTSTDLLKNNNFPHYMISFIKYAFFISMIPLTMFIFSSNEIIISNWHWMTIHTLNLILSFKFDFFSIIFMP